MSLNCPLAFQNIPSLPSFFPASFTAGSLGPADLWILEYISSLEPWKCNIRGY